METGNVDKNLSSEERRILQFLLDNFKKSSKLPTIEETSRALSLHYDEELAEKMSQQFAKRGILGVGLTEKQEKLLQYIIDQDSKFNKTPSFEELAKAFNMGSKDLNSTLVKLEKIGVLARDKDDSRRYKLRSPKRGYDHCVILKDGREEDPACAIDALGVPFMFDQDATITSKDAYSKEDIKIEIKEGEIAAHTPEDLYVYFGDDCATILFFVSKGNIKKWEVSNPHVKGIELSLNQAIALAKKLFENRLKLDFSITGLAYDPKNRKISTVEIS